MELLVTTDLTLINPQSIEFNKDELKAELSAYLENYQGMIVTDDSLPQAKSVRATVNKVCAAINDEKKRIKKLLNDPVMRFEADVKELLTMCESVSNAIDTQIKAFEEATKAAKKAALAEVFASATASISQYAEFEEVFDPRWLNATFDAAEAEKTIKQFAERRMMDVAALEEIEAEPTVKAMLISRYKQTKNLSDVLRLKKEIEERARYEAEQAAAREAAKAAKITQPEAAPVAAPIVPYAPPVAPVKSDEVECFTFRVYATGTKIALLQGYMMAADINFEELF